VIAQETTILFKTTFSALSKTIITKLLKSKTILFSFNELMQISVI